MIAIIISAAYWYFLSILLAALEIEIEGKYGWAYKLPTWYRKNSFVARLYGLTTGGKPLTGYFTFMFIFLLSVFHAQFFMGKEWTLANELSVLAIFFLICPYWDFLWFILNPHYGIKRFQKKYIWWHAGSPWICHVPLDYFLGVAISIACAYGANYLNDNFNLFINHIVIVSSLIVIAIPTTIFIIAPLYKKWYWQMRRHDDRAVTAIFYDLSEKSAGDE